MRSCCPNPDIENRLIAQPLDTSNKPKKDHVTNNNYGKSISLVVVALALLTSCTKHYPAPVRDAGQRTIIKSTKAVSKQLKYVMVKKGDTLYSIGFSHNIDYKHLAKINAIEPPYSIYPGKKIRLQADKRLVINNTTPVNKTVNNVSTHAVKTQGTKFSSITTKKAPLPKPITVNKVPATEPKVVKKITQETTPLLKEPIKKVPVIQASVKKPVRAPPQDVAQSNAKWMWPLKGRVISTFLVSDVSRKGINIAAKLNSSVLASQNGTVVYSGDGLRGYGELIIIKHSNNLLSAYAHNSSRLVKEGAAVKQGQVIAKSGKGTDGLAFLHFEIRKNGQPVNPLKYLPK